MTHVAGARCHTAAGAGAGWVADPRMRRPGEINNEHGGRGVYFEDPAGHTLELITRPYL